VAFFDATFFSRLQTDSMVKRVVVRSKIGGNAQQNPARDQSLVILAAPAVLAAASWGQWQGNDTIAQWQTPIAVLVSVSITLVYLWLRPRTGDDDVQVAVAVYPIGVQLITKVNGVPQGDPVFLARDEIRDCIVNEFILSYKVRSVVMFRVHHSNPDASKNASAIKLVEAFPCVDMTYTECLTARSKIMDYLQQSHQG
jgi:hypothetical protein